MKTLVFDDSARDFVLDLFDKYVDEEGYIAEKSTHERVVNPQGEEVLVCDFAGFVPGSEIVLTRDLPSLLQYANQGCSSGDD